MTKNKRHSTLRIASYNIRKSVGLDWKRNPGRILNVLREIDADIIALQETDKRLGERPGTLSEYDLRNELDYQFVDVENCGTSHGWHGNAILYRDSMTMIACDKIAIPTLEPRGAICGTFLTTNQIELRVIGTHLSLIGATRAKQVEFLSQYIRREQPLLPTIVAGDFNEWRTKGKAYRAAGDDFEVITPGPSFHSSKPKIPLDRFVLSGAITVQNQGVHNTALARKASDHLPIFMDIYI